MAGSELTFEEQYKYDVIVKVINREIKPGFASKLLGISTRQIRRLRITVQDGGSQVLAHGLRGKQGNHHINTALKDKVLTIVEERYSDFKPTFASEILAEKEHIVVNPQTLRRWMNKGGLWKTKKQKKEEYHSWRPRKDYCGELMQFDGSYHHWFEDRYKDENGKSIEVCLLASIDDATGNITKAQFTANEGVAAVFTFWKEYIEKIGKPLAIYLDSFSTYKINHKNAEDNKNLMTQFQRAMKEIHIKLIIAHSPQAKGRVERLFKTLQDRLVRKMRLENINTPEAGNRYLEEIFIPKFNEKFSVKAKIEGNLHRKLSEIEEKNINRTFSIQKTRKVNNDFTIQFENNWYQLLELQPTTIRPKETIIVEGWLNGTIHFNLRNSYLNFIILPERPKRTDKQPAILTTHKLNWKPARDHPWRRLKLKG